VLELHIDADNLTMGDMEDLEEAKTIKQMIDWFVAHAGVSREQMRSLKLSDLDQLRTQTSAAVMVPK
jgi:hypothetical protein